MKLVQRPILKAVEEEDESKYSCYAKTGCKEAKALLSSKFLPDTWLNLHTRARLNIL